INWLERPDRGSVFLHGVRVGYRRSDGGNVLMSDPELAMLRTRVGMVFQHFNLWPHMTALGNVIESPIHVLGRPRGEAVAEGERRRIPRQWPDRGDRAGRGIFRETCQRAGPAVPGALPITEAPMDIEFLTNPDAPPPPPTAAYSHAVRAGDFLFVTGQLGVDP